MGIVKCSKEDFQGGDKEDIETVWRVIEPVGDPIACQVDSRALRRANE